MPRRKPSGALVVTQASFLILQKTHGYFGGTKAHANRFQNHFRGVFPELGLKVHIAERSVSNSPHAAMNVGEAAAVQKIQNPCGDRRSEILVKRRHGTPFDM